MSLIHRKSIRYKTIWDTRRLDRHICWPWW